MDLKELKFNWNKLGKADPFWAVITDNQKKGNQWNLDEFFATGTQEIDELLNTIHNSGITLKARKALDFGCAVGRLSQALAKYFDEVHGVDISPSMLKLANQYNQYGTQVTYHLNDTDDLKLFSDESFDFIYSNITLQHMEPRYSQKYIQEFFRILAPEGLLIFQIPSEQISKLNKNNEASKSKTLAEQIRQQIKRIVPFTLIALYRRIRYGNDRAKEATMEMYGINKDEVIKLIQEFQGLEIIEIKPNTNAGKQWVSFQYWVKKD